MTGEDLREPIVKEIGALQELEWNNDAYIQTMEAYEHLLNVLEMERREVARYLRDINKEIKRIKAKVEEVKSGQVPLLGEFAKPKETTHDISAI